MPLELGMQRRQKEQSQNVPHDRSQSDLEVLSWLYRRLSSQTTKVIQQVQIESKKEGTEGQTEMFSPQWGLSQSASVVE